MNITNVTANIKSQQREQNTTSKGKEKTNNFSSFLDSVTNNITNKNDNNLNFVVNKSNTQNEKQDLTKDVNSTNQVPDKFKKVADNDTKDIKKSDVKDVDSLEKLEDVDKENSDISSQLAQIIENLLTTINDAITDEMEVSVEDLTMVFEKLDISIADLFDPNKVKELLTTLAGDDEMALVADEDLMNLFGDIMDNLSDALSELTDTLDISQEEVLDWLKELDVNVDELLTQENTNLQELVSDVLNKDITEYAPEEEPTLDKKIKSNDNMLDNNVLDTDNVGKQAYKVKLETDDNKESFSDNSDEPKNFMSNLTDSVTNAIENVINTNTESTYQSTQTSLDIINQILDSAKLKGLDNGGSVELTLTPETLGKVNLSVVVKDGVMSANITTQTETAKEAIAANIEILKENLNNQGIKVEEVTVAVASHNLEQNLEEGQRDRGTEETKKDKVGKLIFDENGERIDGVGDGIELTTEEIRRRNPLELNNTKVNYFV